MQARRVRFLGGPAGGAGATTLRVTALRATALAWRKPSRWRRSTALLALLVSAGCAADVARSPARTEIKIKIIAFNDFHGHLQSPGNFAENGLATTPRMPVGGADFLAAHVALLKARNPRHVVVAAGDLVGASPLVSALFHDEPAVEALNRIGVDVSAVGNHEFDKGAAELLRLQKGGCKTSGGAVDATSCKGLGSAAPGRFDGAKFQWLAANVIERATGRPLLAPYAIKTFDGVPVAFIGMTLRGTPGIVAPGGIEGLEFRDEAATVNALVPALHAQGVAAVVVLVHQGGVPAGSAAGASALDINGCGIDAKDGDLKTEGGGASDIGRIVAQLDDAVDLVVSGHTHQAYNCSASTVDVARSGEGAMRSGEAGVRNDESAGVRSGEAGSGSGEGAAHMPRPGGQPNRIGRLVPVTSASAFGRVLTDIDLTIDPLRRRVTRVLAINRLVDRTDAQAAALRDPALGRLVDGYAALAAPLAARPIGRIAASVPNAMSDAGDMPAGNLVADAQLQATQPADRGAAVMAFTNPGGVRSPGFALAGARYPRELTYGDAFTVQPFGNSLVTLTLTAQQIKDLLEQQFAGCRRQGTQRLLQVSNGVKITWRASGAPCAKIEGVTFTPTDLRSVPPVPAGAAQVIVSSGVVRDPARTYRVTVNDFLATGGDGFSVLRTATDALGGPQDLDALVAYLAAYAAPRPAYDPAGAALGLPRWTRLP